MTRGLLFLALVLAPTIVGAQAPPPVRPLGPVVAKSAVGFANISGIRVLSDGRVLVNEPATRRVVLLDTALATMTVVADSTPATANAYSGRFAGLIAYRGDSTLFVDPQSLSMLVIDPSGKIGRVMSIPRADDAGSIASQIGAAGFDRSGRLVYRTFPRMERRRGPMMAQMDHGPPAMPDTAPIVRIDLTTRQLDTVGWVKIPRPNVQVTRSDDGQVQVNMVMNPLPVVDEWALLSDGSIALVRGRDYHIDWIDPDGKRTSSPKLPFEWQRLTDDDKVAFIDSVKAARERMMARGATPGTMVFGGPPPDGGPGTGDRITVIVDGPPGAGPGNRGRAGGGAGGGGARAGSEGRAGGTGDGPGGRRGGQPNISFISASDLPDYKPPFFAGAARADADGNLWIRTIPTKATAGGGPVYDVVSRDAGLVDRVQLPSNRSIVGFGSGGVVYMTVRDGDVTYLERARLK